MRDVNKRRAIEGDWTLRAKICSVYLRSRVTNDCVRPTLPIQEKEIGEGDSYSDRDKAFYI